MHANTYTEQKFTQHTLVFTQIEPTHDSHISKYYIQTCAIYNLMHTGCSSNLICSHKNQHSHDLIYDVSLVLLSQQQENPDPR